MTTQKFMEKHQLIDRLAAQVGSRDMAIGILQKRGQLAPDGQTLTAEGRRRDSMTAEQRALDRATKRTGKKADELKYDPKTNRATLRK